MKKKSIKNLSLNKKSISNLDNNAIGGKLEAPDSLWYCDSEGLGCILETRPGNGWCHSIDTCWCADTVNDYSCQCTIA